jgi:hypothetical protein
MKQSQRIERQIDALTNRLADLLDREAQASRFGTNDEYENGVVITFTRTFVEGQRPYSYAVIKGNGVWWLTGKYSYPLTFEDLIEKHLIDADEVLLVTDGEVL